MWVVLLFAVPRMETETRLRENQMRRQLRAACMAPTAMDAGVCVCGQRYLPCLAPLDMIWTFGSKLRGRHEWTQGTVEQVGARTCQNPGWLEDLKGHSISQSSCHDDTIRRMRQEAGDDAGGKKKRDELR